MPRPAPRTMTVISKTMVTPSLLRVTLGGEGLSGYPQDQEGGYVKLILAPAPGQSKPSVRTYTIRAQREGEIDIDFVLHGDTGQGDGKHGFSPATDWAINAEPGQTIKVGGPGPAKPLPGGFDFYLIAGDMTALPAISVNLAALDRGAKGLAVIEIQCEADRQDLAAPPGVEIRWVLNPEPGMQPALLADTLRAQPWPEGRVSAWVACEFSGMRNLRTYLREERGLGPEELYISSYWKKGIDEETHKLVKRQDLHGSPAES